VSNYYIEGNRRGEETAGFTFPDPLVFKIGVNDIIIKSSVVMISYFSANNVLFKTLNSIADTH